MSEINNIPTVMTQNMATTGFNGGKAKGQGSGGSESWFEALADAWGSAMDKQADKITALSNMLQGSDSPAAPGTTGAAPDGKNLTGNTGGSDQPSVMVKLSAESMKMSFMANAENTSMSSTSQALETMAKKG
jgi:hypothetical protein